MPLKSGDLHSALKTTVLAELEQGGVHWKHVRLQHGKDVSTDTVHARPSTYSSAGLQITDFLHYLGFVRSTCAFHRGECYCRELPAGLDLAVVGKVVAVAFQRFDQGARRLESCGLPIDQPEGWGFFGGRPSEGRTFRNHPTDTDGHTSPKSERMKQSEDPFFHFSLTWIEGGSAKGWTFHYRAKHMPISAEFHAALKFVGGFSWFSGCPEYDFDGCWWRFAPFHSAGQGAFGSNAQYVHQFYDAHANHFSPGLQLLLAAHTDLAPAGLSFLEIASSGSPATAHDSVSLHPTSVVERRAVQRGHTYDVALSFAGTERHLAEKLAELTTKAGYSVFYDGFYPEQLWGRDLAAFFDSVYRKDSRYCVMFVSKEYAERMWTTHERRSAQARAIEERGHEYILPVRIDDTDLDGLPPTVGHLSYPLTSIERIAQLLQKKLRVSG
jgi:hypothetical protein